MLLVNRLGCCGERTVGLKVEVLDANKNAIVTTTINEEHSAYALDLAAGADEWKSVSGAGQSSNFNWKPLVPAAPAAKAEAVPDFKWSIDLPKSLKVHLVADDIQTTDLGDGNLVNKWPDRSGKGNNAVLYTEATRPKKSTDPAIFNGHDSVDFGESDSAKYTCLSMGDRSSQMLTQPGETGLTVFYVVRPDERTTEKHQLNTLFSYGFAADEGYGFELNVNEKGTGATMFTPTKRSHGGSISQSKTLVEDKEPVIITMKYKFAKDSRSEGYMWANDHHAKVNKAQYNLAPAKGHKVRAFTSSNIRKDYGIRGELREDNFFAIGCQSKYGYGSREFRFLDGQIAEMQFYGENLDDTTIRAIRADLQRKYISPDSPAYVEDIN